eukprot:1236347-Amphidinium_carterae.1
MCCCATVQKSRSLEHCFSLVSVHRDKTVDLTHSLTHSLTVTLKDMTALLKFGEAPQTAKLAGMRSAFHSYRAFACCRIVVCLHGSGGWQTTRSACLLHSWADRWTQICKESWTLWHSILGELDTFHAISTATSAESRCLICSSSLLGAAGKVLIACQKPQDLEIAW